MLTRALSWGPGDWGLFLAVPRTPWSFPSLCLSFPLSILTGLSAVYFQARCIRLLPRPPLSLPGHVGICDRVGTGQSKACLWLCLSTCRRLGPKACNRAGSVPLCRAQGPAPAGKCASCVPGSRPECRGA